MADAGVKTREICESEETHQSAKRQKLDVTVEDQEKSLHSDIKNLADFSVHKVLHNNTRSKSVSLLGKFEGLDGLAVVLLEKSAFEQEHLKSKSGFFAKANVLKQIFHNDIYGNYEYFVNEDINCLKTVIIHPATQKEIEKYSTWFPYLVTETQELYEEVILPVIKAKCGSNLQWLYNILDHESETDRILYEDPDPKTGFILLPDLKWNGKTLDTLYMVALVHTRDIKSIRDLTGEHLPLLKNILDNGCKAIQKKYGLSKTHLRTYIHYQPSFYHLHIHFSYLRHEAPGIVAERAHLLPNVISNIELVPDYYQRVTIPYVVRETEDIFKVLEKKGVLSKFSLDDNQNDTK